MNLPSLAVVLVLVLPCADSFNIPVLIYNPQCLSLPICFIEVIAFG